MYTLLLDLGLVKDLGNNRRPSPGSACRKKHIGGAWKGVSYEWSSNKTGVSNGDSPYNQKYHGRWGSWVSISPLSRPSREWRPCLFLSLQLPIMAKLGIESFAHTPIASDLISMYHILLNKARTLYIVLKRYEPPALIYFDVFKTQKLYTMGT